MRAGRKERIGGGDPEKATARISRSGDRRRRRIEKRLALRRRVTSLRLRRLGPLDRDGRMARVSVGSCDRALIGRVTKETLERAGITNALELWTTRRALEDLPGIGPQRASVLWAWADDVAQECSAAAREAKLRAEALERRLQESELAASADLERLAAEERRRTLATTEHHSETKADGE